MKRVEAIQAAIIYTFVSGFISPEREFVKKFYRFVKNDLLLIA